MHTSAAICALRRFVADRGARAKQQRGQASAELSHESWAQRRGTVPVFDMGEGEPESTRQHAIGGDLTADHDGWSGQVTAPPGRQRFAAEAR